MRNEQGAKRISCYFSHRGTEYKKNTEVRGHGGRRFQITALCVSVRGLFVMCPHSDNFDFTLVWNTVFIKFIIVIWQNLINKAVLDIYSA